MWQVEVDKAGEMSKNFAGRAFMPCKELGLHPVGQNFTPGCTLGSLRELSKIPRPQPQPRVIISENWMGRDGWSFSQNMLILSTVALM
jgi:hypothetical protein